MPEDVNYREKWQIAMELIDLARADGVSHRAVVANSWYGNIMEFRRGLDERKKRYVIGIHSDTLVFLESPVFEEPDSQGNKTHSADLVEPKDEQLCPLNPDFLESWKRRKCPFRSSERWKKRQRELKQVSSLPDVRHQVSLCLVRMLF